ncbi:GntR family transcriptional regulator [Marinovum sp. 2_MG-2023]|uniref:GntR family transcriptional regulator n=1 Tax=unclassified Marinovum TaxID=2647166 RepID=UPI0026E16EAC|nr:MULTISPECIES: GntR family transcriptional regulator [unclassified Marinovum]MDO6729591.1 GntR family transcriptional regulator [Marinovum sp. 2_MG-2023]MDO6780255.1 GntR family transcriptional regulator [Marinovum sp. 1_MG-2023]
MSKMNPDKSYGIRNLLIDLVEGEAIGEGDQLPSEATLAARFGVSRNTIRELLVQMETEGLVLRNHGIGTFLRRSPKRHGTYQSFPQLIAESGRTLSVDLQGPMECVPSQAVAEELSASRKAAIQKVERVLSADGTPVVYVVDYLPARILERITDWAGFTGDMVAQIGHAIGDTRFTQNVSINALSADDTLAEKLAVRVGAPIIHVHTLMQTMTMDPVAVTDSFLRPGELPLEYLGTIRVTPNG